MQLLQDVNLHVWWEIVLFVRLGSINTVLHAMLGSTSMSEEPNAHNVLWLIALHALLRHASHARVDTNYHRMANHVQKSIAQRDTCLMAMAVFAHWVLSTQQ